MKKLNLIVLLLFCICSNLIANEVGPDNAFNLVHNYENEWLTYNSSKKEFLPIGKLDQSQKAHYLLIDPNQYPFTTLLIKVNSRNNFLFLNGNLVLQFKANKWEEFRIEELKAKYGTGLLNLSIYGSPDINDKLVLAAYPRKKIVDSLQFNSTPTKAVSLLNIKARNNIPHKNIISFGIVFLLGFIGLLKISQPKEFKVYYSPKKLLDFQLKQQVNLLKSGLGSPNLFFILTLSLIQVVLTFILVQQFSEIGEIKFFSYVNGNTLGDWFAFILLFIYFFISYIIKYFTIYFGGKLFNSDKLIEVHFFKILNIDTQFSMLLLILFLVTLNLGWFSSIFSLNNLRIILFFYLIMRSVILFFTINRQLGFKNLYLISYLCIVEFIPLLIGFRILY